jgi:tetratricopeptide (TPR) repeat protein
MPDPSPLDRLKRSSVVQAVALFLGAAWVVLQVVDLMEDQLGIPEWVFPTAVVLLLIGLVVVLATAWVQSLPSTTEAEVAGQRPSDWEIAPAEAVERIKSGRLPTLTWARAVLGGVVAISGLFGVAGAWVLFTGGSARIGPAELTADEAAEGIAVLPFEVTGPDLEMWREGMVDLLSTGLDGVAGYRTIDSRTVLARWGEEVGEGATPDLRTTLAVAGMTGARYAITGNAVALGPSVRLTTEVYDLADGSKVADGLAEGPADSVLVLVDRLALTTVRDLLGSAGADAVEQQRLGGLTTNSLTAMRFFLEGEALFRRGALAESLAAYEAAIAADSSFALAMYRATDAHGWLAPRSEEALAMEELLKAHLEDLPARERTLARMSVQMSGDSLRSVGPAEAAVRTYPDDPEAWFMLGEIRLHEPGVAGAGHREAREAFDRALELSPSFVPYYTHAIELAVSMGDFTRMEELFVRVEELAPGDPRFEQLVLARDLLYGDREQARRAVESNMELAFVVVRGIRPWPRVLPRAMELVRVLPASGDPGIADFKSVSELAVGRASESIRLWEQIPVGHSTRVTLARHIEELVGPFEELDPEVEYRMERCGNPDHPADGCYQVVAMHAVDAGRTQDVEAAIVWHDVFADSLAGTEGNGPLHGQIHRRIARTIEGYAAWRAGDLGRARAALEEARRLDRFGVTTRWLLAGVQEEQGDLLEAARVLASLDRDPSWSPFAHLRQARLYERMDDEARALEFYESALAAWVDADEDFTPKQEAEAGVARLRG